LAQRGVGRNSAVPLRDIVAHLQGQGINITDTQFQQTVLAESRGLISSLVREIADFILLPLLEMHRRCGIFMKLVFAPNKTI